MKNTILSVMMPRNRPIYNTRGSNKRFISNSFPKRSGIENLLLTTKYSGRSIQQISIWLKINTRLPFLIAMNESISNLISQIQ